MSTFGRARRVLESAVKARAFPGAVVEVGTAERVLALLPAGRLSYEPGSAEVTAETIYDLASLTKVLATAPVAADLVARQVIRLDDPVRRWIAAWTGADRQPVTLRHLLEHASGLPAHRPYYAHLEGRAAFEEALCAEPLEYEPGTRSVYSDAGFILLGLALEHAAGRPLDALFEAWRAAAIDEALPLRFHPPSDWHTRIAPTEVDAWRGRLLVGEVHDENAAALAGVAAHAGLFGTAAAVGACARWWMRAAADETRPVYREFVSRGRVPASSRALAWDTMLPTSSCGTRMSPAAFGHTGFTGTSLWIDPVQDYYVVFLSNRVHPTRAGDAMTRVRPELHDAVAADLAHV
ncbi:MAG: serine hydrolase domain-containing protein [Vicinamibacterales bacterium]